MVDDVSRRRMFDCVGEFDAGVEWRRVAAHSCVNQCVGGGIETLGWSILAP